jgi:hypothetical protein
MTTTMTTMKMMMMMMMKYVACVLAAMVCMWELTGSVGVPGRRVLGARS